MTQKRSQSSGDGSVENDSAAVQPINQTKGSRRRADIVRRAAQLFDERGFHATSMDDIALAVGLRKPSLYHYFASKDDILFLIHDEFIELLIGQHEQRLRIGVDTSSLILEAMVDLIEIMDSHPGYVRVFFEALRELPDGQREKILTRRAYYQSLIVDLFERGNREGVLRDVPPLIAANGLFGMCTWAYHWYRPNGAQRPRDIAYFFWSALMFGIVVPSPPNADGSGAPTPPDLSIPTR